MLSREGHRWTIESGLSINFASTRPIDTLRALAQAIERRNYSAVMKLVAQATRKTIEKNVKERLETLQRWLEKRDSIDVTGDRALIRFGHYKIELVREDGRWKVLDFD